MADQDLTRRIFALREQYRRGPYDDPVQLLDHLAYLYLLRYVGSLDYPAHVQVFKGAYQALRWSNIISIGPEQAAELLREHTVPFLRSLVGVEPDIAEAVQDATFVLSEHALLMRLVELVTDLPIPGVKDGAARAQNFEQLFAELGVDRRGAEHQTPPALIRLMVALAAPVAGENVCDPAAGTGGFLVAAHRHMARLAEHNAASVGRFVGFDINSRMVRIGMMNLLMNSVVNARLQLHDSLAPNAGIAPVFDLVLTNPPFGGFSGYRDTSQRFFLGVPTDRLELQFLQRTLASLKLGGRCAILVPESVLFSRSHASSAIRRWVVEENQLVAVLSLPVGVLRPVTTIKTSIMLIRRGGTSQKVWLYQVPEPQRVRDARRNAAAIEEAFGLASTAFRTWVLGEKVHWLTPTAEEAARRCQVTVAPEQLRENDYNLQVSRYIPADFGAKTAEPATQVISRLLQANAEIRTRLENIQRMLNDGQH